MKQRKLSFLLFIIPFFILGFGIFNLYFFDPFYSHAPDPEYIYLFSGLNVSLLEFNRIFHIDNPGATFQVYCGIIMRITHRLAGTDTIAQDVINRPEFYLRSISFSLIILQALLCVIVAWIGKRRGIHFWKLIILQSGVLLCSTMLWVFSRVNPERWLVVVSLLFIMVYLLYGYKDKHPLKFAIWSGVIMGMGFATKFNFLPIILLPFLFINSNKNRLIYALSGITSFFFFMLPIINKIGYFRDFIVATATHDGFYGGGEKRIFDPDKLKEGFQQLFNQSPTLIVFTLVIVISLILAVIYRKKYELNRQVLFFSGMLFIIVIQVIMVAKHYKFYYMLPLITMYPLVLFVFDEFLQKIGNDKKYTLLPVTLLFIFFTSVTTQKTYQSFQSEKKNMEQREKGLQFVSNLPKNTLWFVCDPTWDIAPYLENAISFGLAYVKWPIYYSAELIKKNPNIMLYDNSEEMVRLWRGDQISIDSIVVTKTPIHLYYSDGRDTEFLIDLLDKVALKNNVIFSKDTIFSNHSPCSYIIVLQNNNSQKNWDTKEYFSLK